MKFSITTALLLLLAVPAATAAPSDLDPDLTRLFTDLLEHSLEGPPHSERAAFITVEADGGLACHLWPASRGFKSESYRGLLPDGLLAIAHTHPHGAERPSAQDAAEAARMGVPIYVLTRTSIMRVDPDRKETRLARTMWLRRDDGEVRPCRPIDPVAVARQHIEKARRPAEQPAASESASRLSAS